MMSDAHDDYRAERELMYETLSEAERGEVPSERVVAGLRARFSE